MSKRPTIPPWIVSISYEWDGEQDEAGNIVAPGTRGFCITTTGQTDIRAPFDEGQFRFMVDDNDEPDEPVPHYGPAGVC